MQVRDDEQLRATIDAWKNSFLKDRCKGPLARLDFFKYY